MKEIELTQGYKALVDDVDFERVNQFKWYAVVNANTVYAQRKVTGEDSKQYNLYLHRFLMDVTNTKIEVDHKDHNGLNCQRHNIRIANQLQNSRNQKKTRGR